nr:hypothetical protein [uncultured Sphingosinicella sp.]
MMPRGFKPVGWVAAVGGAALSCYMLSLNVAAERAEVAKLERQILLAKQDIRTLQTELGTRGRLQQLEHWNAEVLALSAPTSAQFLDDAVTLARFEQRDKSLDEKAKVQMASMETTPRAAPQVQAPAPAQAGRKLAPVDYAAAAERAAAQPQPMLRQASFDPSEAKARVIKAAAVKSAAPAPVKAAPAPVKVAEAKPLTVKVAAAKPAAVKEAKKPEAKTAEVKKAKPKAASLKTMVATLGDEKPAQSSGSSKSRSEAGLR